jgi:ankyrin repeat protein
VGRGGTERGQALLSHGADPNSLDAEGRTPLFIALFERQSDVAALLARHRMTDVQTPVQGYSPLFWAQQMAMVDVAQAMAQRGVR